MPSAPASRRREAAIASTPKRLTTPTTIASAETAEQRPVQHRHPPVERLRRLAEVHQIDDAQVVEGADHAGDHAGDREPDEPASTAAFST